VRLRASSYATIKNITCAETLFRHLDIPSAKTPLRNAPLKKAARRNSDYLHPLRFFSEAVFFPDEEVILDE